MICFTRYCTLPIIEERYTDLEKGITNSIEVLFAASVFFDSTINTICSINLVDCWYAMMYVLMYMRK